ncbi:MAG: DNA alkylation repair protein [Clostridia bacterium]|nr:DNA alkylation repair protein [Clostridia bacterium]
MVKDELIKLSDEKFKQFAQKLTPDTKYKFLGVKVPIVKQMAKNLAKKGDFSFLNEIHEYYEEYLLHGFLIAFAKFDKNKTFSLLNEFLDYVDNWATCDSLAASLKPFFRKNMEETFEFLTSCLKSTKTYKIRFSVVSFLDNFIDEKYIDKIISLTKEIKSEEYYINMAISWLYAEIIVKIPNKIISLIESKTLPKFIQNKSIQKAIESFRVSEEQKQYLKSLKIK